MYNKTLALVLGLLLLPCICFAEPIIKSDVRTFDIMKGLYDLKGNVFVQFPVEKSTMTIKSDAAQVYMYKMEIYGQNNITLSFDDISFACDKVAVYPTKSIAHLTGHMHLKAPDLDIKSDKGSYDWKSKLATFIGNVKVNGKSKPDNTQYNMVTKKFVK